MKKTYMNPEIEVIKLQTMYLLSGSGKEEVQTGGSGSANEAEAPAAHFWEEE